jgi:outer membrane protein OmpA-like peptidoglycan-associated protein/Tfp pilus assembly protein PilF
MAKNAGAIEAKSNPGVLVLKGSTVAADVTVTFPPKYFKEMAILRVTPVLVFDGGEIAGTPKFLQGERVNDNFTVISYSNGGSYTQNVSFPYDPRAAVSTLVLRVEAKCSESCSEKYNDYLALGGGDIAVAQGISNLQDNMRYTDYLSAMPDNFKKTTRISPDEVSIMYTIGQSKVKPAELTSQQVKILQDFIKENSNKAGVAMENVNVSGYASPDGPIDLNDRLSKARGESAKTALEKQLADADFNVAAYGEDWDGFKALVQQSNMKDKQLVLQVLEMYDNPVRRESEIKNLSQVFGVLKDDVLPKLRRAKVTTSAEVQGLNEAELRNAAKNNISSLGVEQILYTASITDDVAEQVRMYTYAAEKYNDARAYNNLGIALMKQDKFDAAQTAFNKAASIKSDPAISNNLGAVALAKGNVAEAKRYLSSLNSAEAQGNKGLLAVAEGDYATAQRNLKGYDLALTQLLNGNVDAAGTALANDTSADGLYLKAIVAARKGDSTGVISNLKSAIAKKASLRDAAKKDVEFAKYWNIADFKAL